MRISEPDLLSALRKSKRPLMVEPFYKRKYPPLGLCKMARYSRLHGGEPTHARRVDAGPWDLILVTSLFTYCSVDVHDVLRQCRDLAPGVPVIVGGVYASVMPGHVEKAFPEVSVFTGFSEELDDVGADLDFPSDIEAPWDDYSFVSTSRGCPNKCAYCAVWRIEPRYRLLPDWRKQIVASKGRVMVTDNNLTACDHDHLFDVFRGLADSGKRITIDSGIDNRLMTRELAQLLKKVTWDWGGLRMAFDRPEEDGLFQQGIAMLKEFHLPSQILVFVLFNFKDTPKEADYRMWECKRLHLWPYPQQFVPLNWTNPERTFAGKHWTLNLAKAFKTYWSYPAMSKATPMFGDYIRARGRRKNHITPEDIKVWDDCPEFEGVGSQAQREWRRKRGVMEAPRRTLLPVASPRAVTGE